MEVVIEELLTLIDLMVLQLGSSPSAAVIDKILVSLIKIVPIIAAQLPNLVSAVQNIIVSLKSTGALTPDQMTATNALNAQVDAAFEAAATAAGYPAGTTGATGS